MRTRTWLSGIFAAFIVVFSALLALLLFTQNKTIGLSGTELHADGIPLETTGDSDLLDVYLCDSGVTYDLLDIRLKTKSPEYGIAFCTDMFIDGERIESDAPEVVIEKYDGSEWQWYKNSEYWDRVESMGIFYHYTDPGSERTEEILFKNAEAGLYRITLFFREITEKEDSHVLNTAPELRSVSFTFEVPDTDKPYNLCEASLERRDIGGADALLEVNLRAANEDVKFPIYLSKSSIELYENSGGRLKKVGGFSDGRVESILPGVQDNPDDCYACESWDRFMRYGAFVFYGIDYDKEYALKMTFFENEDGTGERYSLVLNLVFDE